MNNSNNNNLAILRLVDKFRLPSFVLSSAALEFLKWFAVVSMTIDHVNRLLLKSSVDGMYVFGRLAIPIFACVMAYNLAQPNTFARGVHRRVLYRLAITAVISCVPYIALMKPLQGWWPLNVLFTLLIGAGLVALLESDTKYRHIFALVLFIIGGSLVEFWWAGLAVFFFFWRYFKAPNLIDLFALLFAMFLLGNINGNQWAFASLLIIVSAIFIKINIPRIKYVFYIYYPLHLTCIWGIKSFIID